MTNKLPWRAKNRPCTCPGKICAPCKAKKIVQPQVIVEEPRRLPLPITISYIKPSRKSNPTAVHFMEKFDRWGSRKQTHEAPLKNQTGTPICRWYKERKALKERKKCEELEKKREEYEAKRLKQLLEWEEATKRAQSVPPPTEKNNWDEYKPKRYKSLSPSPIKKKFIKEKSATVKPIAHSKYVTVKKYNPKETLSNRCANCFYRTCCKFYCYLNCIVLIIVIIVLLF